MATISSTMTTPSRIARALFGETEPTYWSSLSETERAACRGSLSKLEHKGKSAWYVAGCLLQCWNGELRERLNSICNEENNVQKIYKTAIYRRRLVRVPWIFSLYLLGPLDKPIEAKPSVFVISSSRTIADNVSSLLSRHGLLEDLGFDFLARKERVLRMLTGAADARNASSTIGDSGKSLCGQRIITTPTPISENSQWRQCTLGGVITLEGRWYGLTVAHPFFDTTLDADMDSDSGSQDSDMSDRVDEDHRHDQSGNTYPYRATLLREPATHGIYLEILSSPAHKAQIPETSSFTRRGSSSGLMSIGRFGKDRSSPTTGLNNIADESLIWCPELDWALVDIKEFHKTPNIIQTANGNLTPFMAQTRQKLANSKVIIASGVSGVIEANVQAGTVGISLPWLNETQEAWVIDYSCVNGDSGAWVVSPNTGLIYGVVVCACPSLQLTYILPAEKIFESILSRSSNAKQQLRDLFPLPDLKSAKVKPERFDVETSMQTPRSTKSRTLANEDITDKYSDVELDETGSDDSRHDIVTGLHPLATSRNQPAERDRHSTTYSTRTDHQSRNENSASRRSSERIDEPQHFNLKSGSGRRHPSLRRTEPQHFSLNPSVRRQHDSILSTSPSSISSNVPWSSSLLSSTSSAIQGAASHTSLSEVSARHRQPSPPMAGASYQYGVLETFSNMSVSGSATIENQFSPLASSPKQSRHGESQQSQHSHPASNRQGSVPSVPPGEYDFKGTPGETEELDPRYKQQKKPAEFFVFGKVFAILCHENVGNSNQGPGPDVIATTIGRYGKRIFSHVRRMVVVRAWYGYCWCVSINTYGGKGVGQKNRSIDEAQAHTIAHDSKRLPVRFENEEDITKEPIAIDMNPGYTLDPRSRLNFAEVFTVEYNVKVMPIGRVAHTSVPYLSSYWGNEMSGD